MKKKRLLFVDDEENVLKSLERVFRCEKYEIMTAEDGIRGLEIIESTNIHLVISDFRMPGMNGIEFLKKVRKISKDTVRIILTAYPDLDTAVASINEGHVYKFLLKPWDEQLLKVEVKKAFELHDLIRQKNMLDNALKVKNRELKDINKNLENLVVERTRQLIHSEKMAILGQLAAQIGHEINNVLVVLKGRLDIFRLSQYDPQEIKNTADILSNEISKLTMQSKNLLSIGRPVEPEFKKIDLRSVLDKSIEGLSNAGVLKYYKIEKHYQEPLSLIDGDESQIQQVIINLLINAHHSMDNKGRIIIGVSEPVDDKYLQAYIEDTGHGIPDENISKIFEPFFTTKPEGKGTGLGMLVVKNIMEEHNGYITVKSRMNKGTKMILGFPKYHKINRKQEKSHEQA